MMVASKRRKQNPNKSARVRRKRVLDGQSDKPEALEDVGEVKEVEEVKESDVDGAWESWRTL